MPKPNVSIISGNIALVQADVIVSTTPPSLDLSKGVLSREVLQHAGNAIQQELQTYLVAYGRPQLGQVVYTSGGSLSCRHVYHLSLPLWQNDVGGQVLAQAVEKCLDLTKSHKATSIAFPTLGVGFLGYPSDASAKLLLTGINLWCLNNNDSVLKDVQLVVFVNDINSLKVFNDEAARFIQLQRGGALGQIRLGTMPVQPAAARQPQALPAAAAVQNQAASGPGGASHPGAQQPPSSPTSQGNKVKNKPGLPIKIVSGEIGRANADVIVSTTHPCLDLKRGVMSRSVRKLAGSSIQQELNTYLQTNGRPQMGQVVCTSGGKLQCQYIYHLSLPMWQVDHGQTLKSAVEECLDMADQRAAASIAFPTLGAGFLGYPVDVVAMIMLSTISTWFDDNPGSCLQKVRIVVFASDTACLQVFQAVRDSICPNKGLKRSLSGSQQATSADTSQPKHWDPMNGDTVKLVDLDPSSSEYQKVLNLSGGLSVKKIQRVQNPTLYKQYRAKRLDLEKNNAYNTANEQKLWHGTSAANIKSIITNGFNRGFSGQNGTKYGHGVYFATKAEISKGYAHNGAVFLARVLVGESTPGDPRYKVPPKKPGSERLYDSLSGPDMVVIFHDAQAYPEYLLILGTATHQGKHAIFQANPGMFQAKPAMFQPNPAMFQTKPPLFQANPGMFQAKPAMFQPNPAMFQTKPPLFQANPAIYQAKPALFQANPAMFPANLARHQASPVQRSPRATTAAYVAGSPAAGHVISGGGSSSDDGDSDAGNSGGWDSDRGDTGGWDSDNGDS